MQPPKKSEVADTVERVTERFRADLPARLETARQALSEWERTGHPREVLRQLHSLVGACGIFGFPTFGLRIRALHEAVVAGAPLGDVQAELGRLCTEEPA